MRRQNPPRPPRTAPSEPPPSTATAAPLETPLRRWAIVAGLLLLALLYSHPALFLSKFQLTPGDFSDAKLINYTLEHDYRWITRQAAHTRYWDTPMFYPRPNATAYTDSLLGVAPPYAIWRLCGFAPDTAFQLWLLTVCALNYLSCYLLLRKILRFGEIASHSGAFLFGFASSRMIQEWHPQMVPGFYCVAALAGLCLFFAPPELASPRRRTGGVLLFFGAATAQLYSSYYLTWFLFFSCLIAGLYALLRPPCRARMLDPLRREWRIVALAGAVSLALAAPFILNSLAALKDLGARPYTEVQALLPGIPSWLRQSEDNWIYGWLDPYLKLPQRTEFWEEANGVGLLTSALVIWGFWKGRRQGLGRILALVCLVFLVLTLRLPEGFSLWKGVYGYVPGASALRAVGRIGLFLLLPAAIALAAAVQNIRTQFSPWMAVLCFAIVAAEQGTSILMADKLMFRRMVEETAARVHPNCESFLFSPPRERWQPVAAQLVGLWAQIQTGVPTLNGYSGGSPPGWEFLDPSIGGPADRDRLRYALHYWQSLNPASLRQVCWIQPASYDSSDLTMQREAFGAPATPPFPLTALELPAGAGTIVSSPSPPDELYSPGASVRLAVRANPGYVFSGWSGDQTGTENPMIVNMAGPRALIANFKATPPPNVIQVFPDSGGGARQTFTAIFSDVRGWRDLEIVHMLFNQAKRDRQACYVAYIPRDNRLLLVGDSGESYASRMPLSGRKRAIENSQCRIDGAGSSASGAGPTLKLTLAITFKDGFSGRQNIYLAAQDRERNNSDWRILGSWQTPAAGADRTRAASAPRPFRYTSPLLWTFASLLACAICLFVARQRKMS